MDETTGDNVFIVRTWTESPGGTHAMRGRIDHVASGQRRYFSNFGELCDFITAAPAFPRSEPLPLGTESGPESPIPGSVAPS